MAYRIRQDCEVYELRGAEVRVARHPRLCDHPLCAKYGIEIGAGERYAYVNTGIAFCDLHYTDEEVEEVTP